MPVFKLAVPEDLDLAEKHFQVNSFVDANSSLPTAVDMKHLNACKKFVKFDDVVFKKKFPQVSRWARCVNFHSVAELATKESVVLGDVMSNLSTKVESVIPGHEIGGGAAAGVLGGELSVQEKRAVKKAEAEQKKKDAEKNKKAHQAPVAKKTDGYVKGSQVKEVDVKVAPMTVREKALPEKDRPSLGVLSKNLVDLKKNPNAKTRYLTTAIHYTNGWPHVGHAYETILADMLARYFRVAGYDTFFQTGTDEHGQKIADASCNEEKRKELFEGGLIKKKDITPKDLCDVYVQAFEGLFQRVEISCNQFIRTSQKEHYQIVQDIWNRAVESGDIYFADYEGWYMVREERFVTNIEAEEFGFKDPSNGNPLEHRSAPSYFFRLSKYQQFIYDKLTKDTNWVKPELYRKELIARFSDPEFKLTDLCISRSNFSWGVPCPENKEKFGLVDGGKQHVMYVWFDALTNYYSGVNFLKENSKYWPANMHVIGKDILWFHTVIWGAMLKSVGLPLPETIMVHGFVNDANGKKMSKSEGNVVNPHDILDWASPDTLRWYTVRGAQYGSDMPFSAQALKLMHNADLCDNLGNLVNRAVSLCKGTLPKFGDMKDADVKKAKEEIGSPFNLAHLRKGFTTAMDNGETLTAVDLVMSACSATNKWIADLAPWKFAKENPEKAAKSYRILVESVYVLAHYFGPFIPLACEAIFKKIGTQPKILSELNGDFISNLTDGQAIKSESVLFIPFSEKQLQCNSNVMKLDESTTAPAASAVPATSSAPAKKTDSSNDKKNQKGGDKKKGGDSDKKNQKGGEKKKGGAPVELDMEQPLYSRLDLRVGKILECENHPDAERLYVEKIDVGEAEPRQIISGLREHYTLQEMVGKSIVAICNLQASKMRGITSYGMVLCAKTAEGKVKFANVPEGSKPGDHILLEGLHDLGDLEKNKKPWDGKSVQKHDVWKQVAEKMKTNADGICCYDGQPLVCNGKRLDSEFKNAILS